MARPCLNDTGREQQLDLIKMISCIAVVGLHCLRSDPFWLCTLIYQLCAFAVPCFFMSSGYILLNRQSIDYRYAFRKIFGIVRVVVLWHILLYGVEFLVEVAREGFQLQKGMETAILCGKNIIRCLLQKGPIWQFWYLGALCLLYLCLPILQKLLRLKEGTSRGWVFWSVTVVVCVAIQGASMIAGRSIQEGVIQSFRLWTWLQYFVLGGLMPALVGRMKEKVPMGVHVVVLLVLTAASVASRWAQDQLLFHTGNRGTVVYADDHGRVYRPCGGPGLVDIGRQSGYRRDAADPGGGCAFDLCFRGFPAEQAPLWEILDPNMIF